MNLVNFGFFFYDRIPYETVFLIFCLSIISNCLFDIIPVRNNSHIIVTLLNCSLINNSIFLKNLCFIFETRRKEKASKQISYVHYYFSFIKKMKNDFVKNNNENYENLFFHNICFFHHYFFPYDYLCSCDFKR